VYLRKRETSARRAYQPPYEERGNLCAKSLPSSLGREREPLREEPLLLLRMEEKPLREEPLLFLP